MNCLERLSYATRIIDEVERLEKQRDELVAALRPFAVADLKADGVNRFYSHYLVAADFARASELLSRLAPSPKPAAAEE